MGQGPNILMAWDGVLHCSSDSILAWGATLLKSIFHWSGSGSGTIHDISWPFKNRTWGKMNWCVFFSNIINFHFHWWQIIFLQQQKTKQKTVIIIMIDWRAMSEYDISASNQILWSFSHLCWLARYNTCWVNCHTQVVVSWVIWHTRPARFF